MRRNAGYANKSYKGESRLFNKPMRSKHNVDMSLEGIAKRTVNGITFDSELEARYYKYILEDSTVKNIKVQPKYLLQESFTKNNKKFLPVELVADFEIEREDGVVVVDIKGMPTETAMLKKKIFEKVHYEKTLVWLTYSKIDGGWVEYGEQRKKTKEQDYINKLKL
jgi:hypothetical protein